MDAEEIVDALLSAFDRPRLTEFMRFSMGCTLDDIATGDSLREVVFKLVDYYQRRGEIGKLVISAALANPSNTVLAGLALREPRAQSRGSGGGSPMNDRSDYGEVERVVNQLVEQVSKVTEAIARLETSAKYIAEASDKRIGAIEKEIEAINRWRSAIDADRERIRDRANEPRSLAQPRWQVWLLVAFMVIMSLVAGIGVWVLMSIERSVG